MRFKRTADSGSRGSSLTLLSRAARPSFGCPEKIRAVPSMWCVREVGAGLRIVAVERDCPAGQYLDRAQRFGQIPCLKADRLAVSDGEAPIRPGKGRVEFHGLLKEFLREQVVVRLAFADMPQAALVGRPGVEVLRRLPHGALLLGIGDGRSNSDRHRL